jgi:hypothetical protein
MSGRLVLGRRAGSERGSVLVLTTIMLTSLLGMTMIVFDLGALRGNVRTDQSVADLAALAAGPGLGANNPTAACQAAANYVSTNAQLASPIDASTFCLPMHTTLCSAGGSGQAAPSVSVGKYLVSIHYPVPDTEIQDPNIVGGARLNDSTQCQRMRVIITSTDSTLFAHMIGTTSLSATRSATVRASAVGPQKTPALWLLDPTGCTSLAVSGGSRVFVGTPTVPGVLTVDSDGSACSSNQHTISSTTSSLLESDPLTGSDTGVIQLYGLPSGATSCPTSGAGQSACNQSEVNGGQIKPQPTPVSARATRARVDDVFNCHSDYPLYHKIALVSTCDPSTTPAYIDKLNTAVGGGPGAPSTGTWTTIGPQAAECSPTASITYPVGNYYVKCSKNTGFTAAGPGVVVTFSGGNVVFDGNVSAASSGTLKFNTANTSAALSSRCTAPTVQIPCIGSSSAKAAIVYIRGDNSTTFATGSGGTIIANNVFVYGGTGSVGISSGTPPIWTAPTEGPFAGLAYWTDMLPATAANATAANSASPAQLANFTITGGGGANLSGVFFTPEASPFKLAGNSSWDAPQHAQFISYQLTVTGGGALTMAPDATNSVKIQTMAGILIR